MLDVTVGRFHRFIGWQWHGCPGTDFAIEFSVGPNLVEAVSFWMKLIERSFISYPKEDENTASDTDGETGNVNEGVESVSKQISNGNDKVIFKHGNGRWNSNYFGLSERYQSVMPFILK
jgi:hypothetical protein